MPSTPQSVPMLEKELQFFYAQKSDFLQRYKGQFVLIKGATLIGTYTTEAEAYAAGVKQLGNVPFLIKLVIDKEEPVWIPLANTGF